MITSMFFVSCLCPFQMSEGVARRGSGTTTPKEKRPSPALDPLSAALEGTDPLSRLAASAASDPLSQMVEHMDLTTAMVG